MAKIEFLNMDMDIGITVNGEKIKATPYFESLLFDYASRMGGEDEDRFETITTVVERAASSGLATLNKLQQQVGSGDFLTCDDNGFTCDATVFSCDMDEA